MAEPSASESSAGTDSDQDFDPSADMMVNDFDDEHTLDEEEALGDEDLNNSNEISELTKEQDIPIEELLQMYGYNQPKSTPSTAAAGTASSTSEKPEQTESSDSSNTSSTVPASQQQSSSTVPARTSTINTSDYSDDDSDGDLSTNEDEWRRTIQVGSDFQAVITDGFKHYDDSMVFNDQMLWKPTTTLYDKDIDPFLFEYAKTTLGDDDLNYSDFNLPYGSHIKDDEQALYLLMQCKYNMNEALKVHESGTEPKAPISEQITPWTEDECRAFENGLRAFGKDFFQIKHNKIPTRSVGEVITFYYFWKKTERHDIFVNKFRIEKKKYALHPGTTDYMDRFAEEQDNLTVNYQNSQIQGTSSSVQSMSQNNSNNSSTLNRPFHADSSNHISINQPNNRQSSSNNNSSAQTSSRYHSSHDAYSAGPTVMISGGNHKRTINVTTTGEPQTILINDSDFTRSNSERPLTLCGGPSNTTTIVVGRNPMVIDGTWVSSSSAPSSVSVTSASASASSAHSSNYSKPPVSIYKIPHSSAFNR